MLHDEVAAGLQQPRGGCRGCGRQFDPVRSPAVERHLRIVRGTSGSRGTARRECTAGWTRRRRRFRHARTARAQVVPQQGDAQRSQVPLGPGVRKLAELHRIHAVAEGTSLATAAAMAPEPVPKSTTLAAGRARAWSMRMLGDGFGLRPRHEDARSHLQFEVPKEGAAGNVLQRNTGGAFGHQVLKAVRRAASISASARTRPRVTPSRWAASNSASTRGEGTPASASRAVAAERASARFVPGTAG